MLGSIDMEKHTVWFWLAWDVRLVTGGLRLVACYL